MSLYSDNSQKMSRAAHWGFFSGISCFPPSTKKKTSTFQLDLNEEAGVQFHTVTPLGKGKICPQSKLGEAEDSSGRRLSPVSAV